jgi:hypothetical protein
MYRIVCGKLDPCAPRSSWIVLRHGIPIALLPTRREAKEIADALNCDRWRQAVRAGARCTKTQPGRSAAHDKARRGR